MVVSFATFTPIFFFLATLIIGGMIFEEQILALEDKFDAWVASKRSAKKSQSTKVVSSKKVAKSRKTEESKFNGFAA